MRVAVLCDFDDTATVQNVAHMLMKRFVGDKAFECRNDFLNGNITFQKYQELVFTMARTNLKIMGDYAAEHSTLRPGFAEMDRMAADTNKGLKFFVVSAGFDFYIKPVLEAADCKNVKFASASCVEDAVGNLRFSYPFDSPSCVDRWATCKCNVLREIVGESKPDIVIFAGDGSTSDACVANKADFVFARDTLLRERKRLNLPVKECKTLREVEAFAKHLASSDI